MRKLPGISRRILSSEDSWRRERVSGSQREGEQGEEGSGDKGT